MYQGYSLAMFHVTRLGTDGTDGRTDRRTDGQTNGRTDGQTNGRTDKHTEKYNTYYVLYILYYLFYTYTLHYIPYTMLIELAYVIWMDGQTDGPMNMKRQILYNIELYIVHIE